jgi:peroxiredoxin/glutaredoxin
MCPDSPSPDASVGPTPAVRDLNGFTLPRDLRLDVLRGGEWHSVESTELFAGRLVVLFGLPGAYTPTCSSLHLPRFDQMAPKLLAVGVDEIVCVSVNDRFVMQRWAAEERVERITMLADGNASLTRALGMLVDKTGDGLGWRSWRYALVVRDGKVEKAFIEPPDPGDPYTVSDADTVLRYLHPSAKLPDEVLLVARTGCPHCARARELLEQAGFEYVEWEPDAHDRIRALGALTGRHTVPQIFLNGRYIGGADALEAELLGPTGAPETRPT